MLPGHVEHSADCTGYEPLWNPLRPLSKRAPSQIFGLYSGFVHFTPLLGADRRQWIGQRNDVVIGALS